MFLSSLDPATLAEAPVGLHGWCWHGTDLIINAADQVPYPLTPGLDGCYVVVERTTTNCLSIGVDARGLAKLFLWRDSADATRWALADSYAELLLGLRRNNVHPPLHERAARMFAATGSFYQQLVTGDTLSQGARLLPADASVVITGTSLKVQRRPVRALRAAHAVHTVRRLRAQAPTQQTYETALREYLEVWTGRFRTLADDPELRMLIDVSGGTDSRVGLAFALAGGVLSLPDDRVRFTSPVHAQADFAAASGIAATHGIELNVPPPADWPRPEPTCARGRMLRHWVHSFLGLYRPMSPSADELDRTFVQFHGAGGEMFKRGYGLAFYKAVLRPLKFLPPALYVDWLRALAASASDTRKVHPGETLGEVHYREFRNRFHFGHRPRVRVQFAPMESTLTDALLPPGRRRDRYQIHYDIIESLVPGLAFEPYDKESKAPSARAQKALTSVEWQARPAGRIFFAPDKPAPANPQPTFPQAIKGLLADALKGDTLARLNPQAYARAQEALAVMEETQANPKDRGLAQAASIAIAVACAAGEMEPPHLPLV